MKNPTIEKNYTTIFADGSIIYENPWLIFPDGTGKWYWNEESRGGVIAWNEIPKGGYKYHKWYRIPDWELRELIMDAEKYAAVEIFNGVNETYLNLYLTEQGLDSYESLADAYLDSYYKDYKCN